MILYHATTPKKLARYGATGAILPPVRGWNTMDAARDWARRVCRPIILRIEVAEAFPLPDHKNQFGRGYWSPQHVERAETAP